MKTIYSTLATLFLLMTSHHVVMAEPVQLTVAGTGDSQALLTQLAAEFHRTAAGRNIRVLIPDSIDSLGGIQALIAGKVPLARTARPLKPGEKRSYPDLQEFLFAKSAVVFALHPSVTGIDNLTGQQIRDIYTGKVRNWKQLGAGNKPIYAVDRETGDSAREVFEDHLNDGFPKGKTRAKVFYTTADAAAAIAEHKFTIGFIDLVAAKKKKLKILAIDGVAPTEDNIASGAYKYVTPFYIISNKNPSGPRKTFIDFLYTERAKQIIRAAGSIPAK